MIFHQIQLMVCAVRARRFASRWKDRCRTVQAGANSNTAAHLK
jgi:predicted Na+-dependent transporter